MNIQDMLNEIKARTSLSDGAVALRLTEMGARATQSTVWRLRTGAHSSTSFELGRAIERLYHTVAAEN